MAWLQKVQSMTWHIIHFAIQIYMDTYIIMHANSNNFILFNPEFQKQLASQSP